MTEPTAPGVEPSATLTNRSTRIQVVAHLSLTGFERTVLGGDPGPLNLTDAQVTATEDSWSIDGDTTARGATSVTVHLSGKNKWNNTMSGIFTAPTGTDRDRSAPENVRVGHVQDLPAALRRVIEEATGIKFADYGVMR